MAVNVEDAKIIVLSTLSKHSQLKGLSFTKHTNDVTIEDISTGNVNNVFRIINKHKTRQSVVVKHAPPYIKLLGPAYPCGTERGFIEFKAYQKFHDISPGSVPVPYFYDEDSKVLCVEDLREYKDYRQQLMAGKVNIKLAESLGRHLAKIHSATHISNIGEKGVAKLNNKFENWNLVSVTKTYVFTGPFTRGHPTNRCSETVTPHLDDIYKDQEVLNNSKKLRTLFLNHKECLVHGDLHTGSIMATDDDVRITDAEFAFVGPAAYDLGVLFANYMFAYFHHLSRPAGCDGHTVAFQILDCCSAVLSVYQETITSYSGESKKEYIKKLTSQAVGFAGCELIRRTVGVAHVEDTEDYPEVEPEVLGAGIRLLKAYERIFDVGSMLVTGLILC